MTDKQTYIETKVITTTFGAEVIEAILLSHGIDTVTIEDKTDIYRILSGKDHIEWDYADPSLFGIDSTQAADISRGEAPEKAAHLSDNPSDVTLTFYTKDDEEDRANLVDINKVIDTLLEKAKAGAFGPDADFGKLEITSHALLDDWKEKWKENFKPITVTERIAVCPPWEEYERKGDELVIVIDPGMAFGTGSHETTAMCISALEREAAPEVSVIDIGAGSGILSIAAKMLGAGKVVAVEIDEDAAESMQANFSRNNVADKIESIVGDIRDEKTMKSLVIAASEPQSTNNSTTGEGIADQVRNDGISLHSGVIAGDSALFDIVVANLTGGLLLAILPAIRSLLKPNGKIIFSGLLDTEENKMTEALGSNGYRVTEKEIRGEWLLICADFTRIQN